MMFTPHAHIHNNVENDQFLHKNYHSSALEAFIQAYHWRYIISVAAIRRYGNDFPTAVLKKSCL